MEQITLSKEELINVVSEASEKAASEAVEKALKDRGMEAVAAAKFIGRSGKTAEELAGLEAKGKAAEFIKAVYRKDGNALSAMKAMNEGTGADGGFVVPQEWAAEVFRVVEDFGLVAKLATKFPMSGSTLNVPRLSASVSVYWPGEGVVGTSAQPTLEQVQLEAKTLVGLTPMSNELLADANVSIINLLTTLFAEAIAGEIDNQGLAGSGSPFTGVLTDAGVTVYQPATSSTFTLAANPLFARALISKIKPWALQGAVFVMHRSVWALYQSSQDSNNGFILSTFNPVLTGNTQANGTQGYPLGVAGTLWGYPVLLSDKMPSTTAISTKFVIFGNLAHIFLGMRQDLAVAISQEATVDSVNLFAANMSAVRVTTRVAIAVGLPTAFAVQETSAS
jgi:HK97 family phage major capsid protein